MTPNVHNFSCDPVHGKRPPLMDAFFCRPKLRNPRLPCQNACERRHERTIKMADQPKPSGPDLTLGIAQHEIADGGKLLGHVGEDEVLLVRRGAEFFAVGAHCTHYHGPLVEGLVVGDTVRCPWHHACFDLRTGEALRAPALSPLACWSVEQRDGKIFVREKRAQPKPKPRGKASGEAPEKNRDRRRRRRRLSRPRRCSGASNIRAASSC